MNTAVEVLAWWAVLLALWVTTLTTLTVWEVVVGAAVALPCAALARAVRVVLGCRWSIRLRWAAWLGPLIVVATTDTVELLAKTIRNTAPRSRFRTIRLPEHASAAERSGRHAVASAVLSGTPSTLVTDDHVDDGRIVLHQWGSGGERLVRAVRR